jgi:hypothetical protein
MRVETSADSIAALDHNAVGIGMQEFVIEEDGPLSVVHLSVTMCHE